MRCVYFPQRFSIVSLSQSQAVVDAEEQELRSCLHMTEDEVDGLQQACHTHLDERQKSRDACELLKLFKEHYPEAKHSKGEQLRTHTPDLQEHAGRSTTPIPTHS